MTIREGDHVTFTYGDGTPDAGTVQNIFQDGGEWAEYSNGEPVAEIFLDGGCYTAQAIKDLKRSEQ